jgi:hypothetical protein
MATPVLQLLSAPVRPMLELYLASSPLAVPGWAAVVGAMVAAAVWLMLRVDVAYAEHALAASRRQAERLRRMQAGGAVAAAGAERRRVRLPAPRFLGSCRPLARRQLTELARNPRVLLGPALLTALVLVPLFTAQFVPFDFRRTRPHRLPPLAAAAAAAAAAAGRGRGRAGPHARARGLGCRCSAR